MKSRRLHLLSAGACVLALLSAGCTLSLLDLPTLPGVATPVPGSPLPTATMLPKAQSVFIATLPEPLGDGEALALALLDEVTGLPYNTELYPMQGLDPTTYSATLALPHRAVIKYRYVRLGSAQIAEDTALDWPIRYRVYVASAPAEVRDIVASWGDRSSDAETGSMQGRILNSDTGQPVPDIMVSAAGQRAFTDSAGRFDLPGILPGTHNVVAYAIDGTFAPFQQGATVAPGLNTAIEIRLRAAPLVKVTFLVSAPNDVQGAPVRIAGNLVELGNTFADLRGGMSTVAERMPVMALQPDGRYSATLSLPAGTHIQYKYTLGDGFWNAEHDAGGAFELRELIVPDQDALVQDAVATWNAGDSAPILFDVTVASNTPATDLVSIQFNPFGWTEPLPMWPMGSGRWLYKLYGPISQMANLHYRYCRVGQCGSADDLSTAGAAAQGRLLETSLLTQDIKDSVSEWAWLGETEPGALVGSNIAPRPEGFAAGVEFRSGYQPNWSYYNPQAVQSAQALGANWLVFTPGWTYTSSSPLTFGIQPQTDPFWLDSTIMISQARAANLNVGLFPIPRFVETPAEFWLRAPRDQAWWQDWFELYRAFVVHHADLASSTGSQALILGGDWLGPALPSGRLSDGSASDVPSDAALRWRAILVEAREHFDGPIWWALPYSPGESEGSLDYLASADGIYLLWSAPLALEGGASKADLLAQAEHLLDSEVAPLAAQTDKSMMLALAYPSADGVKTGCLSDAGGCLHWTVFDQPDGAASVNVDLGAQLDMYEAVLNAVNTRPYIGGIISRGFFPPTLLQDKSASVHGKPAADLLWYWFPRLTGVIR